MKVIRIILVLAALAALAFGLVATSRLGALEVQITDLNAQLATAREDLALSEQINQAFEKERAGMQDTIDQLQTAAQSPAAGETVPPEQEAPVA